MTLTRAARRFSAVPRIAPLGLAALAFAAPAASAGALEGAYEGSLVRGTASAQVDSGHKATMRFALKRPCGTARGTLRLGALTGAGFRARGKAKIRGRRTRALVAGRVSETGDTISGKLKVKPAGRCAAARRRFVLRHAETDGPAAHAKGTYEGTTTEGLPITVTVGADRTTGRTVIENVAWQTNLECRSVLDPRKLILGNVGYLDGLSGPVTEDGEFELFVYDEGSPNDQFDNVDYDAVGSLDSGRVYGEVYVGWARFDASGVLNPLGPLQCWEAAFDPVTFEAHRV